MSTSPASTPVPRNQDQEYLPALTEQDYERMEAAERAQGLSVTPRPVGWDHLQRPNSGLRDRVTTESASKSTCCPCPNLFSWGNKKEKTD